MPLDVNVLSGREAASMGSAERYPRSGDAHQRAGTGQTHRGDRKKFYPHERSHADGSACYEVFQRWDFGFVHEVLATERVDAKQWSARMDACADAGSRRVPGRTPTYGPHPSVPKSLRSGESKRSTGTIELSAATSGSSWAATSGGSTGLDSRN